jgi:tRNA-specific 2-thiouridylase
MKTRARIVVAMSGGVDSSTAAALLAREGHEVIGVGLKFPNVAPAGGSVRSCCGIRGMDDARRMAEHIGIEFHVFDYEKIFEETVIDYFCDAYLHGMTPNPCVECNRLVKFGRLLKFADGVRADYVATGHYARIAEDKEMGRRLLKKGIDSEKDQSYFLYPLTQEQLSRSLFPLGEMTKKETRKLAKGFGLEVSDKQASQDVCFITDGDYRRFLAQKHPEALEKGPIVDTSGRVLGEHRGIAFYTVGQRRGLGVARGVPLYVIRVDPATKSIIVGTREESLRKKILVSRLNWIAFERLQGPLKARVKMRYRQREIPATIRQREDDRVEVELSRPARTVAPGQSAVFYDGDVVVGGGIIE